MKWTELNAMLKFEISATWNCKGVTANCGLQFPMENLMLKVSIDHEKPEAKSLIKNVDLRKSLTTLPSFSTQGKRFVFVFLNR